jgi:hypothetical protein
MRQDPIVEEIHQTRRELAARFNFDVKAIFADLRERQASLGDRLVMQKKRTELEAVVPPTCPEMVQRAAVVAKEAF